MILSDLKKSIGKILISLIFIYLTLTFWVNIALAQFGVKGGVSTSGLLSKHRDFRPFIGYEVDWVQNGVSNPRIGFQVGAFYCLNISRNFVFQPELSYSQRGYYFDQTPLYDTKIKINLSYVELPFLLKYRRDIENPKSCQWSMPHLEM